MTEAVAQQDLVEVRIVGLPLDVRARAQEHSDGLTREFALIATSLSSDSVPKRLQELSDQLQTQYGMYTANVQAAIDEATLRGETQIDVTYSVPREARDATFALNAMLEEADEFCQQGDLLTLATPPELVRFRRWFLGEFVRQINGGEPVAWRDYADDWPPA